MLSVTLQGRVLQCNGSLCCCSCSVGSLTCSHRVFNHAQGSSAMSQIMIQKLGALPHLSPLLSSPNPNLQKTAVSLLGNMSRSSSSSVQSTMGEGAFDFFYFQDLLKTAGVDFMLSNTSPLPPSSEAGAARADGPPLLQPQGAGDQ